MAGPKIGATPLADSQSEPVVDDGSLAVHLTSQISGERPSGPQGYMATINDYPDYKVCGAGASTTLQNGAGGVGDLLGYLLVSVGASGAITIADGANTVFSHTFSAALNAPVEIPIGRFSTNGAWIITMPASVTCTAFGDWK